MTTTTLPEPTVRQRMPRVIVVSWPLGRTDAEGWDLYAVLSIGHDTPGVNYYAGTRHGNRYRASLYCEGRGEGGISRFTAFTGMPVLYEDITRFNAKKFAAFAERAQREVETRYAEGDEKIRRYFDSTEA